MDDNQNETHHLDLLLQDQDDSNEHNGQAQAQEEDAQM